MSVRDLDEYGSGDYMIVIQPYVLRQSEFGPDVLGYAIVNRITGVTEGEATALPYAVQAARQAQDALDQIRAMLADSKLVKDGPANDSIFH